MIIKNGLYQKAFTCLLPELIPPPAGAPLRLNKGECLYDSPEL